MSSRQTLANPNAKASTGPKSAQGKACVAQNARRHGLALSVLTDPCYSAEVEALAQTIAASFVAAADHPPALLPPPLPLARRVAEAQVDLMRIRQTRHDLLVPAFRTDRLAALCAIDRYERRALSRRKFAIRDLDAARRNEPPASRPLVQRTTPAK